MIFVFKTSVTTNRQVQQLKPHIDSTLPNAKWNFDLHDADNILRIDSKDDIVLTITCLLHIHNYHCKELM